MELFYWFLCCIPFINSGISSLMVSQIRFLSLMWSCVFCMALTISLIYLTYSWYCNESVINFQNPLQVLCSVWLIIENFNKLWLEWIPNIMPILVALLGNGQKEKSSIFQIVCHVKNCFKWFTTLQLSIRFSVSKNDKISFWYIELSLVSIKGSNLTTLGFR